MAALATAERKSPDVVTGKLVEVSAPAEKSKPLKLDTLVDEVFQKALALLEETQKAEEERLSCDPHTRCYDALRVDNYTFPDGTCAPLLIFYMRNHDSKTHKPFADDCIEVYEEIYEQTMMVTSYASKGNIEILMDRIHYKIKCPGY